MTRDPREPAAIFVGGMAGAVARVWVGERFATSATTWPWATFLVNVAGAAILAVLVTQLRRRPPRATARRPASGYARPLLGTGFCGAFTTFSTMQVELVAMLRAGSDGLAIGYAAASLAAGYLAVWGSSSIVRRARVAG